MAICVIAVVGVAPCQCFSLGANQTTSPGRISSVGPSQRCAQPKPNVTINVCPSGCVCQAVRAPGSNVTLAQATRAGSGAWNSGSIRTVPVNQSAGPLFEGCDPHFLISILDSFLWIDALAARHRSMLTRHSLNSHGSAQQFHRVSAHANVRDTLAVSRCSHIHFARTPNLDALSNQHLFVTVCDPVLHHPTRGATGRRSRSGIFNAIREHA